MFNIELTEHGRNNSDNALNTPVIPVSIHPYKKLSCR